MLLIQCTLREIILAIHAQHRFRQADGGLTGATGVAFHPLLLPYIITLYNV